MDLILYKHQRKNIKKSGNYDMMKLPHILKLCDFIKKNPFGDKCVIYHGEIKKNRPIFSFKGKKVMLYKLLYHNFVDDITGKYDFDNSCRKIECCCINHIIFKTHKI